MSFRGLFAALSAAAFLFLVFFFAASLLVALAVAVPVFLLIGAIFGRRPRLVVVRMRPDPFEGRDQRFGNPHFGEAGRQPRPAGPVIDHEP
ncbi:hypothetical protein [Zavarzinia compransoris]|uniref:Uncharacterized protein n=1 Tax=Zavarzinia compransoris TaxID=1264899 RepID=A0A317E430_9PROT|nr:hypothetical protein [Zavarzinia compransoris]PWR20916.1 hypothetical protein DKG75_13075 [Zavarzinia compransoris]TDP44246.1 hypothetical protein DES42_10711 [Zavarzinia compransoris]